MIYPPFRRWQLGNNQIDDMEHLQFIVWIFVIYVPSFKLN